MESKDDWKDQDGVYVVEVATTTLLQTHRFGGFLSVSFGLILCVTRTPKGTETKAARVGVRFVVTGDCHDVTGK